MYVSSGTGKYLLYVECRDVLEDNTFKAKAKGV